MEAVCSFAFTSPLRDSKQIVTCMRLYKNARTSNKESGDKPSVDQVKSYREREREREIEKKRNREEEIERERFREREEKKRVRERERERESE